MAIFQDIDSRGFSRLTCGALRATNEEEEIVLEGWVNRRRDLGGLIFIDLRDRYGITQITFNPEIMPEAHAAASEVRNEYVLRIRGIVRKRPDGTVNPRLDTGEIEIEGRSVEILNASKTPPFYINEEAEVDESLRLTHRYLDLRRARMQRNVIVRHQVVKFMRDYFDTRGFVEVETPLLIKSTPEGARDFLVPSSASPGEFYALPQSPQQLKQLLMVAGLDRYFQIARCFRDEAHRADRQPEFTQLDLEMSFVREGDIMQLIEQMFIELMERFSEKAVVAKPFTRLSYADAMDRYGSDRPDIRYGLEFQNVSGALAETGFNAFAGVLASGGEVKGIVVPGGAKYSRREVDEFTEVAKRGGAKGLAWIALGEEGIRSSIAKFLTEAEIAALTTGIGAVTGDLCLFVADQPAVVAKSLSGLREFFGEKLELADPNVLAFCWITEFPLLEWDEAGARWDATHNPFSGYYEEDAPLLDTEPNKVRAKQYDITLNGFEVGGGSVRLHRREDQEKIFGLMGHSEEARQERFGAILDALEYGAPPHGGIALGLDRLLMILCDENNIREVMAFPKNQRGVDLMLAAPSPVDDLQLKDVGLQLRPVAPTA
ncbi:aspartate--tRNA ligase [soil metagenome]